MPCPTDVPLLHRALLRQVCWSAAGKSGPRVGGEGYTLPDFQAGQCFDVSLPGDRAALLALGVRAGATAEPNHVYLETGQAGLSVDLRFEGAGSCLVIGEVAGLAGSFLFLGHGSSVVVSNSPGEVLAISADLIGDGAGVFFGRDITCYGARCTVENTNSIRVGDACLFSDRIDLRASDSHTLFSLETGEIVNPPGSITIEPSVWVGTTVLVLKGTRIGAGSVVGAHSVVTRDIPSCCVAVGSPARVVRENVSWHRTYPGSLPDHRFRMTARGSVPYRPDATPEAGLLGGAEGKPTAAHRMLQPRDVVAALYRKLLLRDPDAAGLESFTGKLAEGGLHLDAVIGAFLECEEFGRIGPQFRATYGLASQVRFVNDVSQYGEVERLLRRWVNDAALHRIVVDVGARGRDRSNSYDLLRSFGWRGILIEANPALIPSITAEFAGLDVELVNCAVSDYEGTATFHLGVNDDVSSLNEQAARDWGPVAGQQQVTVTRLGTLLRARGIPHDFDLLSLDIEGEDIKVLNDTIDCFEYRPRWVIIEASYDFRTKSLDDIPVSDGVKAAYRIADQTEANLILQAI